MEYIFNLANGRKWKLKSLSEKTDFVTGNYARVCSMKESSNNIDCEIFCSVDTTEDIEEIREYHPDYIETGRKEYVRIFFSPDYKESMVFFNPENLDHENLKYLSTNYISRAFQIQAIKNYKALPCHCALVEINGKGAVIGAVGDCGKSTCAERLPKPHNALADDYAMIYPINGDLVAQAMPTWSVFMSGDRDYQANCTQSTKINTFFFLKQSKTDYVERTNGVIAHQHLNNNFQDLLALRVLKDQPEGFGEEIRTKIFDMAGKISGKWPTYFLHATLHGDFWNKMNEVMEE